MRCWAVLLDARHGLAAGDREIAAPLPPRPKPAVERGGHLHVGLEEHYDPDRQPTNVELLEEAVALCREVGRPVATCAQAAEILAVP